MNREVYRHLFATHLRKPLFWVSLIFEFIRSIIIRVYVVTLFADITSLIARGDYGEAKSRIILYSIVALLAGVIGNLGDLIGNRTENNEYEIGTLNYYKKLVGKDLSFYKNNHSGYLTTTYRQYLDSNIILARFIRTDLIKATVSLTIPVIVLLFVIPKVGLAVLLILFIQIVYILWSSAKAQKYRMATNEIYRKLSGEVNDDITNIVAFKSAAKEDDAFLHIKKRGEQETDAFWMRRKTTILLDFPRNIITSVMVGATFWLVLDNPGSSSEVVGALTLTLFYIFQILRNISDIPDLIGRHDDLVTKIVPTLEVLKHTNENVRDPVNPKKLEIVEGSITLEKVTFSYDNEKTKVLNNFNLVIKGGETIGIVGLSGAGKSTLASLLMRFEDITEGSISIDGTDIKEIRQRDLRSVIAYVPQEPLLFHKTIKENICYMKKGSPENEIIRAAKAAHAHEFISDLALGYNTIVGERGIKLSGGQKQRVVIARAVLKNAPIILFDEATSALDSESEHIIQKALPKIIGKHTAIIIAHRLSTVAKLDRIIVMHNGSIEEEGTHSQLIRKKGRYYRLWMRQTDAN